MKKVQERPQVLGLQAHGPVGRDQFLERDDRFGIGGMAEYSRGYSWRPSERRELNEGASYRRDWQPRGDWATVLGEIGMALVNRADHVLPNVPLAESVPYFAALWRHAAQGTSETLAALLAASRGVDVDSRQDADDVMQGALLAVLAAGQWAEQDTELLRTDGPPTRIAPRSDGTIHGDIERKVVGQFDELGYLSMTGDELTARATMFLRGTRDVQFGPTSRSRRGQRASEARADEIELIGTDRHNWEQVIDWRPESYELTGTTLNGRPIGKVLLAPEGAGDSIQLAPATPRKRTTRPHKARRVAYHKPQRTWVAGPVHDITCAYPPVSVLAVWPTVRGRDEYITSADITRGNTKLSRHIPGRRGWIHPVVKVPAVAKPKVTRKRAKPAEVPTVTLSEALATIEAAMLAAMKAQQDHAVTLKVGSHRVTVRSVPTDRAYRIHVTDKLTGQNVNRKVRTLAGIASAVRKHTA